MRPAACGIKSCPSPSYKVLPSLSRNLRPFGLQSSNWQPRSSQYYGHTSVRIGSAEESNQVAVIWSLFLAWSLSLLARPSEAVQRSCADSPGRGELNERELLWLQELTLPLLETKPSSKLGMSCSGFRLGVSLSCVLKLSHCSRPLLDCLIDQKS